MKYLVFLFLCLASIACSAPNDTPEVGQTGQGLGALFLINGTVADGGGGYVAPYLPATYKPSIKKLDGMAFFGYPSSGYQFPLKHLTLILKDSSGNVLDTLVDLPPGPLLYEGAFITQTVTTSFTTQVKKVTATAEDANGVALTLNLDVI